MFSSNTNGSNGRSREAGTSPLPVAPAPSGGKRGMFSVLGADVVITGNITATADLHIDGQVMGDVECNVLVQGTESRIAGNLRAETARISGTVEGTVSVRQLTVERTARINGDVEYETVSIENGASIDGRLTHVAPGLSKIVTGPTTPILMVRPVGASIDTVHIV